MGRSRWPLVALFIGIALLCARLGVWQLDRLRQRRAMNASVLAARNASPVDLNAVERVTAVAPGRPVVARGRYDFENEVVVMGRMLEGTPGVHVLTPLRLAGTERVVLVNRGFVPAADGFTVTLDSLQEPGAVMVRGLAQPFATSSDASPPTRRGGYLTVSRPHFGSLRERLPYQLAHVIVQQESAQAVPALPRRLPPPRLDDGPHLGYAIQWFAFAVIALVFAGVVGRRGAGSRSAPD